MLRIVSRLVPPPAGVPSPLAWGTEERLAELFAGAVSVDVVCRQFQFRFRSADDYFETFKAYYGPVFRAWNVLDDDGKQSLRDELVALADGANRDTSGALIVPSDYLEVVVTARAR
jgi:hypothetical protein